LKKGGGRGDHESEKTSGFVPVSQPAREAGGSKIGTRNGRKRVQEGVEILRVEKSSGTKREEKERLQGKMREWGARFIWTGKANNRKKEGRSTRLF